MQKVSNRLAEVSNLSEKPWCALGESNPSCKIENLAIPASFKGLCSLMDLWAMFGFNGLGQWCLKNTASFPAG